MTRILGSDLEPERGLAMHLRELSMRTFKQTAQKRGPRGLTWVRGCERVLPGGALAGSTAPGHARLCGKLSRWGLSEQGLGISKVRDVAFGSGRNVCIRCFSSDFILEVGLISLLGFLSPCFACCSCCYYFALSIFNSLGGKGTLKAWYCAVRSNIME